MRGPVAWMAANPVASNLLMAVLLVGGLFGLLRLTQEIFPEFTLDMVTVMVAYPGASPAEVEQGILLAVEEEVRGLDGVKYVRSTAAESLGMVTVEMLRGTDPDRFLSDVKSAVDRIASFPQDAERPVISLQSRKRDVISVILSGEVDPRALHALAERSRAVLLDSGKVTQIELEGVPPLEVAIEIPRETLEAYGLSLEEVARQVAAASVELPAGGVKTRGGEVLVRVTDRRLAGWQFADIVLRAAGGAEVRLADVARITDGFAETDQASYFDGKPAVRLRVYRVGDETPAGVAAAVREHVDELRPSLPAPVQAAIWDDDSQLLQERMDLLLSNAQLGLVLVFLTLALFLRMRLAFWVAMGIPISFMGAFLVMQGYDISINMITLFAFIITLGIVVDDAIVVGENVYHYQQEGLSRLEAAIRGAREMAVPVTFSVLTTVAAFAPLLFIPGVVGKIFGLIPVVVITVLLVSLVEAFFILPAHLGHGGADRPGKIASTIRRVQDAVTRGLDRFVERFYRPHLSWAIAHRWTTLSIGLALLAVAWALVGSGRVPFSFFPKLEGDVIRATARLPYGTPLERTRTVQVALERAALEALQDHGGREKLLLGMFTQIGEARGRTDTGSHLVSVELELVPSDLRKVGADTIAGTWNERMPALPGIESLVISASAGPGAGAPVNVQLSHPDVKVLADASRELATTLLGYPALKDVDNSYASGKPQLDFRIRPEGRALGFTSQEIARQLRSSFFGADAIREQRGRNEVRVRVRLPREQRGSEYDVEELMVRAPDGGAVPLAYVADFTRGRSPTVIQREGGERIVNVSAELAPGTSSAREVLQSLETDVVPALQERFPGLKADMVGQERERQESFGSLGSNFLIALFVIYAMIAIPFRSYAQGVIVMAAIPFGFIGAVGGHVMLGYGLSIMSIMGMVALAGVVVNDSIVMIDAANTARRSGKGPLEAIVYAGTRRLRPIILTSVTTFAGLAPMVAERSVQARFLIPMAISLAFGVMFATLITLLLVPALYMIAEDLRASALRLLGRPVSAPGGSAARAP